jgi:hypothetical protein
MQQLLVQILIMKGLAACFLLVSCLAHFSTLNMEAESSSETSVNFYQTTRCYIPEDTLKHFIFLHPRRIPRLIGIFRQWPNVGGASDSKP